MLVLLLLLVLFVPVYLTVTAHRALSRAATYYVDSMKGNDSCNGTSMAPYSAYPNCAWQSFLHVTGQPFDSGSNICRGVPLRVPWQGTGTDQALLHPLGSGLGTPISGVITISHYCNANLYTCSREPEPVLDGNGDQATVYLAHQQYWDINNLTIENCGGCAPADRKGVWVFAQDDGVLHHIHLSSLTVHDVQGLTDKSDQSKLTGGIIFQVYEPTQDSNPVQTWFDDVQITHNVIYSVHHTGIFMHSDWQGCVQNNCNAQAGNPCHITGTWVASTNILVDSNTIHDVGGTGISVQVSTGQVVSNNIVYNGQLDGTVSDGIISYDSLHAVIKQNLVYDWQFHGADQNSNPDAMAFDTDNCDIGATFEYNFSHDNQGGFLLVVEDSQAAVVRYNISERDGYGSSNADREFIINNNFGTETGNGMQVYDNDIYMDDKYQQQTGSKGTGLLQNAFQTGLPVQPFFENNLVENLQNNPNDTNTSCSAPQFGPGSGGTAWTVSNNDFYGAGTPPGSCPNTPTQSNGISGDPLFTSAGNGYNAAWPQGTIQAYTLQTGNPSSPALCAGTPINNNGSVDFAGNSLPSGAVDAGALEYEHPPTDC